MHVTVMRNESAPQHIARSMAALELIAIIPNRSLSLVHAHTNPTRHNAQRTLQDSKRVLKAIPAKPMLTHLNLLFLECYNRGVAVLDVPRRGPDDAVVVRPKMLFRVGDFPGPARAAYDTRTTTRGT